MKKTMKFGLATIVASGLTAGIFGVASPIEMTPIAETLPVVELPGQSTGTDHDRRVSVIHQSMRIAQVDDIVQQSR